MKSIHLLLSAVLLSAAAPFLEQQQLDQLRTEQQQQFNQLQQQPDPFQRQQERGGVDIAGVGSPVEGGRGVRVETARAGHSSSSYRDEQGRRAGRDHRPEDA